MANSSIIAKAKNAIIKEIINNPLIVKAIDAPKIDINSSENLVNNFVFNFHQNPITITEVQTFMTIQVHIPRLSARESAGSGFVKPVVEIWIFSNVNHMKITNIPKVKSNRNDYLSELLDQTLNGYSGIGIGELRLISNIESSYQSDYVCRCMTFETVDLNKSLC